MNNNRNNFRPGQREVDEVSKKARATGRDGAVIGGVSGYLAGALASRRLRKARLAGAAIGALSGHAIGKTVGRRTAAKDDIASRAALRNMEARLDSLEAFRDERRGRNVPIDLDAAFADLTHFASELSGNEEAEVQVETDAADILLSAREQFVALVGLPAVNAMSEKELACHLLSASRRGVISLDRPLTTIDFGMEFAIDTRLRTPSGTFQPGGQMAPDAASRAYSPDRKKRRTLKATAAVGGGAAVVAAAILGHRKLRNARVPKLSAGGQPIVRDFAADGSWPSHGLAGATGVRPPLSSPQRARLNGDGTLLPVTETLDGTYPLRGALAGATLRKLRRSRAARMAVGELPAARDFARSDDDARPLRNGMIAGTGIAASILGAAALLRRRKAKLRLAPGSGKVIDIDSSPVGLARVNMPPSPFGGPSRLIRRPRRGGALLARLRQFGLGNVVVEGLVDAAGLGSATDTPKKKKIPVDKFGNPLNPNYQSPTFLPDPGLSSASSFSAIGKLGGAASRYLPEVGAIAAGDVLAESAHDKIVATREKKRRRLLRAGVQANSGLPSAPTTMSVIGDSIHEFATDSVRDRAHQRAVEVGAATAGAAAGTYGSLATYRPGRPAQPGEDLRGKRVVVKRKSVLPSYHVGVGTESGGVLHRTPGRDDMREVRPETFRRQGRGGLRVEEHSTDRPAAQVAADASRAKKSKTNPYRTATENCEHTANRLVEGKPISRQVRRAIGGAVTGAGVVAALAALRRKRQEDK